MADSGALADDPILNFDVDDEFLTFANEGNKELNKIVLPKAAICLFASDLRTVSRHFDALNFEVFVHITVALAHFLVTLTFFHFGATHCLLN